MIDKIIKDGATIQVVLSADDLRAFGFNLLSEYAAQEAKKREMEDAEEIYLTTAQACEILHVTRSTLWRWQKSGFFMPTNIGGCNRYAKSEIKKMMEGRI